MIGVPSKGTVCTECMDLLFDEMVISATVSVPKFLQASLSHTKGFTQVAFDVASNYTTSINRHANSPFSLMIYFYVYFEILFFLLSKFLGVGQARETTYQI